MVYEVDLKGKTVNLRSVNLEDAEFTLNIRNDPALTRFIPKISVSIQEQLQWIKNQREKKGDYFFLIIDKSENKLGTMSIYNICGNKAESGRFISQGNSLQNMEALLLIYDFAFYQLDLELLYFEVYKQNKAVVNMWKRLGSIILDERTINGVDIFCFELSKVRYEECFRPKIADMLIKCI